MKGLCLHPLKNSMLKGLVSLSLALLFLSCVDPLDLSTDRTARLLVVDGGVSTLPGPYRIRLSESAKYGNASDGVIRGVSGAEVSIRDDTGLVIPLDEFEEGYYFTPDTFRAVVGRAYSLLIETTEGKCYLSAPEKIQAVSPIDSLSFEAETVLSRDPSGQIVEKNVVSVSTHMSDPSASRDYYIWRTEGTYKIDTNPELYDNPNPDIPPLPKVCCSTCWITESNETIFVLERDQFINGGSVTKKVAQLEDNGYYFQDKYLIRVSQSSISKDAYDFFSLLQNQLSISGDVFDPPPATIRGNMFSLDEPDEAIIGFFTASDTKQDSIFIFRSNLDIPSDDIFIPDDCRLVNRENNTTIPPPYW